MIIVLVIICLSILILIHELGHFLTAKFFGIEVEEFGIGFPPQLWSKKMGGTIYSVNALPFGGFVKIHGEDVRVRADVRVIDGYSAHADEEQLLAFVDEMHDNLERVFVVQGEPAAALGLQQTIQDRLGVPAVAPLYGEKFEL